MTEHRGRVRVEPGAKRVRAYLGGHVVADTTHPLLVWEAPYFPAYYLPRHDVRAEVLTSSPRTEHSPSRGDARYYHVAVGDRVVEDAAWEYPDSPIEELRGHVRFEWAAMDSWFEEDDEVFVHPRDPYSRVDILSSSRHVQVAIAGVQVADTHRPTLLFETGLPTRYYLPKVDVRMDLLRPSPRTSACPYKGFAQYWSATTPTGVVDDIGWGYRTPLPESQKIAGLVCFYNERVDLTVDGALQDRPHTKFS